MRATIILQTVLAIMVAGAVALPADDALAGQKKRKGRSPASIERTNASLSAPHLKQPVPASPDWAVGVEVATKIQSEPSPRPVLARPEFLKSSADSPPPHTRDERFLRKQYWTLAR